MDTTTPTTEAPVEAPKPRARYVTVPGGRARLVAEVLLVPAARPDEELVLQALEVAGGEPLLRMGYRRTGRVMRGPVSATPSELAALVALATAEPAMAGLLGGAAP